MYTHTHTWKHVKTLESGTHWRTSRANMCLALSWASFRCGFSQTHRTRGLNMGFFLWGLLWNAKCNEIFIGHWRLKRTVDLLSRAHESSQSCLCVCVRVVCVTPSNSRAFSCTNINLQSINPTEQLLLTHINAACARVLGTRVPARARPVRLCAHSSISAYPKSKEDSSHRVDDAQRRPPSSHLSMNTLMRTIILYTYRRYTLIPDTIL